MRKQATKRNSLPTEYEQIAWRKKLHIVGIDEAGRGCLAGPVVAGAVALFQEQTHPLLKDSKKLSPKQRETAYRWITTHAFYSVGIIPAAQIDTTNILQATKQAMLIALRLLCAQLEKSSISLILSDAVKLTQTFEIPHEAHNFGEDLSISIAAASIIAKETRDRIMERQEAYFPHFGFAKHKGYGTAQHRKEILSNHASLIHRMSFAPLKQPKEVDEQQTILFW